MKKVPLSKTFGVFAERASCAMGSPGAFGLALIIVLVWGASGPLFHYSDTWQLVINTGTTIITFLMVFLIQHTQNRDTEALRLKVDELIRAIEAADNRFLDVEDMDDEERRAAYAAFQRIGKERAVSGEAKSQG